jgi:hypothetical protein
MSVLSTDNKMLESTMTERSAVPNPPTEPAYDTRIGHASPWQDVCACGHRLIQGFVACGRRSGQPADKGRGCACVAEQDEQEPELPDL